MTDSQTTADTAADALAFADELRKDYVDKEQLCAGIGISTRTLDRMEVRREGPPRTKIGKRVLYRKAAVREWLESREHTHTHTRRRRAA